MFSTQNRLCERPGGRKSLFSDSTPYGIAITAYLLLLFFDFVQVVPGVSPARLGGFALLVFFFFNWKEIRLKLDVMTGLLFGLILISFVCLLSMPDPVAGINPCLSLCLNCGICILGRSLPYSSGDYRMCLSSLVVGGLIMVAMMFISPGAVGTEWVSERAVVNIGGSQQDPNEFCGYLILALTFFVVSAFLSSHFILIVPACIILYAALLTGSRGGLISLVGGAICALVFGLSKSKHRLTALIAGAFVLVVLIMNFDAIMKALPQSVSQRFYTASFSSGTASFRINAWIDVLQAFLQSSILQQIIGHGFGMTMLVTFNGLVAHNAFVEMIYACGILGLCCYVGIWITSIMSCVKSSGYVELASLVAFAALLCTLSDFSMKVCWGLFLLTSIRAIAVEASHEYSPAEKTSSGE